MHRRTECNPVVVIFLLERRKKLFFVRNQFKTNFWAAISVYIYLYTFM